jgi:hypothetical protein
VALARHAAFLVLVLAAGLVGLALLAAPGATGRFFAWGLAPEGLAAFAGGVYALPAGALVAALRTGSDPVGYLAVLVLLLGCGAALLAAVGRRPPA